MLGESKFINAGKMNRNVNENKDDRKNINGLINLVTSENIREYGLICDFCRFRIFMCLMGCAPAEHEKGFLACSIKQ